MADYYSASNLGVDVGGTVCGAQSFSVSVGGPVTPIFQLGSVTNCGVMQAPSRGTATLTVQGDIAVVTGTWADIIQTEIGDIGCPLFGITGAICTGVTFTGRAGSPPSATYTFTGKEYTTGGGGAPGACGCSVATESILGPTAAYSISASCSVSFLEQFGSADLLGIVCEQPRVTGTFEFYLGTGAATSVTIGDMSVTLDEELESSQGGNGSVGGFGTYSVTYFGGSEGSVTGGLTIA